MHDDPKRHLKPLFKKYGMETVLECASEYLKENKCKEPYAVCLEDDIDKAIINYKKRYEFLNLEDNEC